VKRSGVAREEADQFFCVGRLEAFVGDLHGRTLVTETAVRPGGTYFTQRDPIADLT
jgi:hypothetical protein